jgi:hypothetical protein
MVLSGWRRMFLKFRRRGGEGFGAPAGACPNREAHQAYFCVWRRIFGVWDWLLAIRDWQAGLGVVSEVAVQEQSSAQSPRSTDGARVSGGLGGGMRPGRLVTGQENRWRGCQSRHRTRRAAHPIRATMDQRGGMVGPHLADAGALLGAGQRQPDLSAMERQRLYRHYL